MRFVTIFAFSLLGTTSLSLLSLSPAHALGGDNDTVRAVTADSVGADPTPEAAAAGLVALEQAAASGDAGAKATLGRILLEGIFQQADPDRGEALLLEAAEADHPKAMISLANAYLWGLYGRPIDAEKSRALFEQAIAFGDPEALRLYGDQLVRGTEFDRDTTRGIEMLERAVELGAPKAQITLGSLYLDGIHLRRDEARAKVLFEAAARAGDGEGLELLGADIMWNRRGSQRAEKYLLRAADLGRGSAWTTLAKGAMYGYLGKRSRSKFLGYAHNAREAGQSEVAVLDAHRALWGISMRASGPKAIRGLEEAVAQDNEAALKFLISLVRDGNRWNVRRNSRMAQTYLAEHSDLLSAAEIAQYELSFDVAKTKNVKQFGALAERYAETPGAKSAWFGQELYAANPNFAMYLLQARMKDAGNYGGALNGMATKATLKSIWRECRELGYSRNCGDSVLEPSIVGALLAR